MHGGHMYEGDEKYEYLTGKFLMKETTQEEYAYMVGYY